MTDDKGAAPKPAPTKSAREQLTELRAKRAAEELAEQEAAAPAIAERELREEIALQAAIKAHGRDRVAQVLTSRGMILLRPSNPTLFRRYQDEADFSHSKMLALVMPCVVYPEVSQFEALLQDLPGLTLRCSNAITKLAGFDEADAAGKS